MIEVPENPALRATLEECTTEVLAERLRALRPALHNTTDLSDRVRTIRAIEIAEYTQTHEPPPAPEVKAMLIGTRWDRPVLQRRIAVRLKERLAGALIEEVEQLHDAGHPWERLEWLGLEYRFISQFLQGHIKNRNDLLQKLCAAIAQFAKRQETWFRRMERNGHIIHWVDQADFTAALAVIAQHAAMDQ
jgi:tRNA dimethylallyltransferase